MLTLILFAAIIFFEKCKKVLQIAEAMCYNVENEYSIQEVTQMGYREDFFKHNPGVKRFLRTGRWYRCVSCKRMFRKRDITVDHRIPKRKGGTDDLWNLQPMCKHCNSSKRDHNSGFETAGTLMRAAAHGKLGKAVLGIEKQKLKDAVGIKYKRK